MAFLRKLKIPPHDKTLKYNLHKHLSRYETARPLKKVHASELTKPEGFCARFYALADLTHYEPKDEFLTTSLSMTYSMGRVLQDFVVNAFADMGKCIGHWRCMACNKLHTFKPRPTACKACGCKGFKPEEVRFESAISGASCGVDMLVNLGFPKLIPVEIKTIKNEDFRKLAGPLAEHKLRTNLYLRLIAESDSDYVAHVDTTQARVIYIDKGAYGIADQTLKVMGLWDQFSPFKEFEIERDDSQTDALVAMAMKVKEFRTTKAIPKGICASSMAKRASDCHLRKACFSGEFKPS